MIVLKVHSERIAVAKTESDAEWAIDMDAPDAFANAFQFVQAESREQVIPAKAGIQ